MTIVNDCTIGGTTAAPGPKLAVMVNGELPAAVGVPLMTPVDEFRFKPAGSVPVVTAQLATVAPATLRVDEYGTFMKPLGRVAGAIPWPCVDSGGRVVSRSIA